MRFLLAVLVVCALVLSACGNDPAPSPNDAVVESASAEQPQDQAQAAPSLQQQQQEGVSTATESGSAARGAREPGQASAGQQQQVGQSQPQSPAQQAPAEQPAVPQATQSEADIPPDNAPPTPQYDAGLAQRYVEWIAGEIGPRPSGSEQELAAAEFLAEQFAAFGYEVELQPFDYTHDQRWSRIDLDDLSIYAFHFSGAATDLVAGELVAVEGYGEPENFKQADVLGKIAVVNRGLLEFRAKAANAQGAGALALIVTNTQSTDSLTGTFGSETFDIPVLLVNHEDAARLREQLGERVTIHPPPAASASSQNVVARMPAATCRVVVGGHYDTVPGVDGANDNASGTALTLALASLWAEHPATSDICFVAFGAEEVGLFGSAAYVRSLRERGELADISAMLNLDAIGDGRRDLLVIASTELREMALHVAVSLGGVASRGTLPINLGSDHASFAQAGVPVVFLFPLGAVLHTPLDNLEFFDRRLFAEIGRINHHILACLLHRADSPLAPTVACARG